MERILGMNGEGSFGWCSIVVTLELLGLRRKSGKIRVITDSDVYELYLETGRLMLATSSNQALRLGLLLIRRGLVEPLSLQDLLHANPGQERRQALGKMLVTEGILSRGDLTTGVEEQCVEVLARILECDQACFEFIADDPLPAVEVVPLDTDRLLAEASRRHLERLGRRVMERLLPRPHARLTLAVQLALVSAYLSDAELLVALAVDRGTATLDALAVTLPLDALTLQRTVISLLERGYLVVGPSPLGRRRL